MRGPARLAEGAAVAHNVQATQGGAISVEPRINDRIRVPEVRLVGPNGEQVGIVRIEDALRLAVESDLDLVEVAPNSKPPVCKLMDYGKFKYESAVKAREDRKKQVNTVIKEMKLRPKIDPHDYETKKGHVVRFLKQGDKVKITIMFRGREQSRPELGYRLLQRLAEEIAEYGVVESSPKQDGRNMIMVVAPTKRKVDARAERDAARQARTGRRAGVTLRTMTPRPSRARQAHAVGDHRGRTRSGTPRAVNRGEATMPKMKTHSGTKKRVKVTGSGELVHEQVNKRHRLEVKTSKRSRKLQHGLRRLRRRHQERQAPARHALTAPTTNTKE